VGWTNNSGADIVNPGKLIWNAAGSLLQPIFNANANRARVKIAKAQQEESKLSFQQTLLNAGAEVNNALTQCQSARAKADLRERQIEALERAVESSRTADAARLDHLPRSADRPAVAAFGTAVVHRRPFRRNPGNREPLPGSRRRT